MPILNSSSVIKQKIQFDTAFSSDALNTGKIYLKTAIILIHPITQLNFIYNLNIFNLIRKSTIQ